MGATPAPGANQVYMNTTSLLNNLIETLKDGQAGFREAANDVASPELRSLFLEYSDQRARFASELQFAAREQGEMRPENSGSMAGAFHRGWINLKSALTSKDDKAILTECERGEDSAVSQFEKAMEERELPIDLATTIRAQYSQIKAAHNHVRDLRNAIAA
jgi:uncharacterized protein (TIGR02284 family)